MDSLFSPNFFIGHIRIGSVEGASCVNMGNNVLTGFQSRKKHNQGFGNVSGNRNNVTGTNASLDDSDFLDVFNGSEEEMPSWVRELIPGGQEKIFSK